MNATAAPDLGSELECFVNDASTSVECEEFINQVIENSGGRCTFRNRSMGGMDACVSWCW